MFSNNLRFKAFRLMVFGLLLTILTTHLFSENPAGLKGRVVDQAEHAPIQNVYILAHRTGTTDKTVRTDDSGRYSIELSPGIYDVFISADWFAPTCRKVKVESNGMMVFDATLNASSIGAQE